MLVSGALFAALTHAHIDHTHQPMDVSDHWPIVATFDLTSAAAASGSLPPTTDSLPSTPSALPVPLGGEGGQEGEEGEEGGEDEDDEHDRYDHLILAATAVVAYLLGAISGAVLVVRYGRRPTAGGARATDATITTEMSTSASSAAMWELNDAAQAAHNS